MFDKLLDFLMANEAYSLVLIFLILVACGLGLPIPEDITLVAGGVLVSSHTTNIWKTIFVSMAGVLVGDSIIYWMGRIWGQRLFQGRIMSKIIKPSLFNVAAKAFHRFGDKVIFIARFLPGLRAPIYFFVGTLKKPYTFFLSIDALAALISVPVWIYVGKIFGENLDYLEKLIKRMKVGSLLFAILLILLLIFAHYFKNSVIKKFESLSNSNDKTEK